MLAPLFWLLGRSDMVGRHHTCALATVFLVLYWAGAARRRERELLHALGASRRELAFISWLEGAMLLLAGLLLGELLGRLGAWAVFSALGGATAVDSSVPLTFQELAAPAALLAAGSLGSLICSYSQQPILSEDR